MDALSSSFLLTVATISVTFVGFSSIVVVFRQVQGSSLDKLHIFLVRFFIEMGLIVTAFALLPLLLAVFQLAEAQVWEAASTAYLLCHIGYVFVLIRRWGRHASKPFSLRRNLAAVIISVVVDLGLALNALGWSFGHTVGPYALAISWGLVVGGLFFVQTLSAFLEPA
jgi:hypothetical protein